MLTVVGAPSRPYGCACCFPAPYGSAPRMTASASAGARATSAAYTRTVRYPSRCSLASLRRSAEQPRTSGRAPPRRRPTPVS
jgi:hypothetical protein